MKREDAKAMAEELAREWEAVWHPSGSWDPVSRERFVDFILRALERAALVKPDRIEAAERAVIEAVDQAGGEAWWGRDALPPQEIGEALARLRVERERRDTVLCSDDTAGRGALGFIFSSNVVPCCYTEGVSGQGLEGGRRCPHPAVVWFGDPLGQGWCANHNPLYTTMRARDTVRCTKPAGHIGEGDPEHEAPLGVWRWRA